MTNQPENVGPAAVVAATPQEQARISETKQALLKDIRLKWGKFSDQELTDLKSNDELVTQIVAKYGLEKMTAQRDADTLRAGRDI